MPVTTLAEIVARTLTVWGGLRTRPYSMGNPPPRADCSSYVWEVLGLPSPIGSTVNIVDHLVPIAWGEAQPGDVWGKLGPGTAGANGHIAVITGTPRTRSDGRWEVVEQSGPTGVYGPTRNVYSTPPSGYRAYRSKYVTGAPVDPNAFPWPYGHVAGHYNIQNARGEYHGGQNPADRPYIQRIQQRLIELGYDVGPDGADGWFGDNTKAAVEAWQRDAGRPVDGTIGADDWPVLFAPKPQPPQQPAEPQEPQPPATVDLVQLLAEVHAAVLRIEAKVDALTVERTTETKLEVAEADLSRVVRSVLAEVLSVYAQGGAAALTALVSAGKE